VAQEIKQLSCKHEAWCSNSNTTKNQKKPNKPTKKIVKTQVTEWKKIFSNHVTNKKLVFRI
jgi:hypothetical protein